jgi:tetratricopeptide (TPR) repeat protein
MIRYSFLLAVVFSASTALADDAKQMGTAGLYRFIPGANCGQPLAAQLAGSCDPEPVDETLPTADKIQAHIDRAVRLIMLFRDKAAREAADQAIALDPGSVAALKFRGRLALNTGDAETAWRDINVALKISPNDSDLLANRAYLRLGRSEIDLAMRDATAAIKANPRNTDALWGRSRMLTQQGQVSEAMVDLDAALLEEPDFNLARLFRAQAYLRMGKFEACLKDADILIEKRPRDQSALQVRALARYALGQFAEAVNDLTALLGAPGDGTTSPAMSPINRPFLLQRMIIFVRLGRKEEAQKDMDMLLTGGGKPGVMQLQLYLRRNGFSDVPLDGERSQRLEDALRACIEEKVCLQGLTQRT